MLYGLKSIYLEFDLNEYAGTDDTLRLDDRFRRDDALRMDNTISLIDAVRSYTNRNIHAQAAEMLKKPCNWVMGLGARAADLRGVKMRSISPDDRSSIHLALAETEKTRSDSGFEVAFEYVRHHHLIPLPRLEQRDRLDKYEDLETIITIWVADLQLDIERIFKGLNADTITCETWVMVLTRFATFSADCLKLRGHLGLSSYTPSRSRSCMEHESLLTGLLILLTVTCCLIIGLTMWDVWSGMAGA